MDTITRNGVSLKFDKEGSSKGLYILTVKGDTNDADYISKTTLLDGEQFSSFLPAIFILFEIWDRHFYDMPRLLRFFENAYELCEALNIPSGTCDIRTHSVSSVQVTYFEDGKFYEFTPWDIPEEKRKELVFNFLVNEVEAPDEFEYDDSEDEDFDYGFDEDDEDEDDEDEDDEDEYGEDEDDEVKVIDKEEAARQIIEEIF